MVNLSEDGNNINVTTGAYSLRILADRPYMVLTAGGTITELCALASAHSTRKRDDTSQLGTWQVENADESDRVVLSLATASSVWKRKTIRMICYDQRLLYEVELSGRGQLDEVNLLGGYCSGRPEWGTGFFWSGQNFRRGFSPALGVPSLHYAEGIDATLEPFEEEDYRLVREVWETYRKNYHLAS